MNNDSPTTPQTTADAAPVNGPKQDALNALRGFLMGAADIVPGVSGGTVALILGVYQRLLGAISRFDGKFVTLLAQRRWRSAATHVDLRLLTALGGGVLLGVASLAGLMHHLLENHQSLTYAAFFGLILASGLLVGRMCRPKGRSQAAGCLALGALAAGAALGLVTLGVLDPRPGLPYTFLCGAIAICAMILPGISGSYLLVMLGKYHEITGLIKGLPRGETSGADLVTLAVFAAGCLVGLLAFSKFLKWLLARCWTPTMAVLCGFMIGSLYRIWPFQIDTTPGEEEFKRKVFEPYWPEAFDRQAQLCLAITAAAFVGVLVIDAVARRKSVELSDGKVDSSGR